MVRVCSRARVCVCAYDAHVCASPCTDNCRTVREVRARYVSGLRDIVVTIELVQESPGQVVYFVYLSITHPDTGFIKRH